MYLEENEVKSFILFVSIVLISSLLYGCKPTLATVDENQVVGGLMKESEPFSSFYSSERARMPKDMNWTIGGSFPPGVEAYTELQTNTIHLRQIPPFPNDEFIIAHELCGFILKAQGFPCSRPKLGVSNAGDASRISAALNSMLWTPLGDSILTKYGYDLEEQYSLYLGSFFTYRRQPKNEIERFEITYFYVQMVIYWEDILKKEGLSDFQEVFDKDYPDLARYGQYTLRKIRAYGYDSPEKMKSFYDDILKGSNLDSILQD
jgi:hypothetical protein